MMALALGGLLLLVWLGYSRMAVLIAILGLPGLMRRSFVPSATGMSPRENVAHHPRLCPIHGRAWRPALFRLGSLSRLFGRHEKRRPGSRLFHVCQSRLRR